MIKSVLQKEIQDALRINLQGFSEGGLRPDSDVVTKYLAGYIVGLMQFDDIIDRARTADPTPPTSLGKEPDGIVG